MVEAAQTTATASRTDSVPSAAMVVRRADGATVEGCVTDLAGDAAAFGVFLGFATSSGSPP